MDTKQKYSILTITQDQKNNQQQYTITVLNQDQGTSQVFTITEAQPEYKTLTTLYHQLQKQQLTKDNFIQKVLDLVLSHSLIGFAQHCQKDQYLSAHAQVKDGHIVIDGNRLNSVLEKAIMNCLNKDPETNHKNVVGFVHFAEKLFNNTSMYVRRQLYGWMRYQQQHGQFTITPNGNFIAYKGCCLSNIDGTPTPVSFSQGHGIVNGKEYFNDNLPNIEGQYVEIPRSEVDPDPAVACSSGLHVGTWDYALDFSKSSDFALGVIVAVEVNPVDVVSVPQDYDCQKIRTCRYKVLHVTKQQCQNVLFDNFDNHEIQFDNQTTPTATSQKVTAAKKKLSPADIENNEQALEYPVTLTYINAKKQQRILHQVKIIRTQEQYNDDGTAVKYLVVQYPENGQMKQNLLNPQRISEIQIDV